MKITIKYLCIALLSIITFTSCGSSSDQQKAEEQTVLPAKLETVSLGIEGMTCEIGCAKTIESKISKVEGVTVSNVDFEAKKGTFTYDSNKTSKATIVSTINGLLDGKTYKATNVESCCAAKEVKTCTKACAEKCGHKVGETCEKCASKKESCDVPTNAKECTQACAEKCGHKLGETCENCSEKKESCKPGCDKPCCLTKS